MKNVIGIKSDRIIFPDGIKSGIIYFSQGRILSLEDSELPGVQITDFTGLYVAPGFIDMHTHGALGYSFLGGTEEEILKCCQFHMEHGTTTIVPTLSAAAVDKMEASTSVVAQIMDQSKCPITIAGVHWEGPYLSAKQAGAQLPGLITPPAANDYESVVSRLGKYITRWTYAPESDACYAFTEFLKNNGILASVGHSDARYEELLPAYEKGCRLVTHLYSCTSTVTREKGFRHLGIIESAYLLRDMDVEIIADGCHLPPELIRMIVQIKGRDHVVLCTDSVAPTGLPYKEEVMQLGELTYIIEDGVAKLPDRSAFQGSIATADRLVRVLVKDCGLPVEDAVYMLTAVPARLLKLNKGRFCVGADADIVVFDDNISINAVYAKGTRLL